MIKLLIKLKCKLFSELLAECLSKEKEFNVVDITGIELNGMPDITITDRYMLNDDLVNRYRDSKLLLLDTGIQKEDLVSLLIKYKLKGILSIDSNKEQFKKALKVIHNGQIWINNELIKELIDKEKFNNIGKIKLTDKEMEIIKLVCSGLSNKEISSKLFISEQTVKAHLHRIYQKLGIKNRSQLVLIFSKNI